MATHTRRRAPPARAKRKRARRLARGLLITLGVASALLAVGLLDRDTGVGRWRQLQRDARAAQARIADAKARIAAREAEAAALASDPAAIEAAIREDLRLARPGEWVVREKGLTSLRNP